MFTQVMVKLTVAACLVGVVTISGLGRTKRLKSIPEGVWGAQHISVTVENGAARIEYDCGHGMINGPLRIDSRGRFSLTGTHVREGGPIHIDAERGVPARFTGWTDGKKMTLTVILVDHNQTLGTFTLTRGQSVRLRKCQ